MKIGKNLTILPVLHGRIGVTKAIRPMLNTGHYDCIALPLPTMIEEEFMELIEELPTIQTIVLQSPEEVALIPADPCDAFIEAARQAHQLRTQLECIGPDRIEEPETLISPPDETLIKSIGYDAWCALTLEKIALDETEAEVTDTIRTLAQEAKRLDYEYDRPILLLEIHRIPAFLRAYESDEKPGTFEPVPLEVQTCPINVAHLFFVLGELPFVTGEYEKNRAMLFEKDLSVPDMVKRLFLETRDSYSKNKEEKNHFSLTRLQQGITFLRNLTLQEKRIAPNIFNMITAAKGIGGDSFALKVLKASNFYPYFPVEFNDLDYLSIGMTKEGKLLAKIAGNEGIPATNLLTDTQMMWRSISLKPDKEIWHSQNSTYRWNMENLCSHVPEDLFIENFNRHVRGKAIKILTDMQSRTEEFATSFKDGIDIRETLRNWHTGKIHVKETPKFHGGVDTVIIIFDRSHDERYPIITTWYAEHNNESTLSFYGTDPFSNTIGPGVAECSYGGLSLIFPPRSIPDITHFSLVNGNDELPFYVQLTLYSLFYSKEQIVAYVADDEPTQFLKKKAKEMGKHLLWIPMSSFSGETVRKLRKFHMLDGYEVRSWASRFIGE